MKKIRFLATGDFHSDKNLIEIIKNYVNIKNIDFIIFTGDISEKKDDFKEMFGIFEGKQIFMIPGNHETKKHLQILKKHYNVHLIGNSPVIIGDNLALFGSNYLHIGPYGIQEKEILDNIIDNFNSIKDIKTKILLSHLPPDSTSISDASPFFPYIRGSMAVRVFLENFEPDFALVGHIHESSGLEEIVNKTRVLNVGRTFKIFELDIEKENIHITN